MNAKQIIILKKLDFINIHVLMKLLVKDFYIGMMNILQLIPLISLQDVLIIININLKKYKLIMKQNLLIIKKERIKVLYPMRVLNYLTPIEMIQNYSIKKINQSYDQVIYKNYVSHH